MRSIGKLFAAFANLAAAVNGLAAVIDAASGRLRQTLALDIEPAAATLEHKPAGSDAEAETPAAKRNGRAKTPA